MRKKVKPKDKALKVIRQLAKTVQIAHLDQNVASPHYADGRYQLQHGNSIIGNNDL